MPYVTEVLADSPLAYWRLGEASGTTAADASGNSRPGTYLNSPTLAVTGLQTSDSDTAMSIADNSTQTMSVASAAWMDVASITVEAFVKFSSSTDVTNGDAIVSRYHSPNFNWLLWRNTSGKLAFQIRNTAGTAYNVSDPINASLGTTYHVVGTFNGSTCVLYVNGTAVATTAVTGTVQTGGGSIDVGRYSDSASTSPGAVIDEVSVYNSSLSSTRILAHYSASGLGIPNAQVEATYLETMTTGTASAQVEAGYIETMASGTANVQVGTNYVETMTLVQPVQVESVYAETLLTTSPPTQIEAVYAETLLTTSPPVQIEMVYIETLVLPLPTVGFTGWGMAI